MQIVFQNTIIVIQVTLNAVFRVIQVQQSLSNKRPIWQILFANVSERSPRCYEKAFKILNDRFTRYSVHTG